MTMIQDSTLLSWPWAADRERHTHAAVRHLILTHQHDRELSKFMLALDGEQKLGAAGVVDISINPAASYARQLSVPGVYGDTPAIYGPPGSENLINPGADRAAAPRGLLWRAGWASLMPQVEYFARGSGCVAVLPSVDPDFEGHPSGPLALRIVHQHNLYVLVSDARPMQPLEVWEARVVNREPGTSIGGREVFYRWSIADPENPFLSIHDRHAVNGPDIAADVDPPILGQRGDGYHWRYQDGTPYIPHTFYRVQAGDFWGIDFGRALHRGAFQGGRASTWAHYAMIAGAANPQFLLNCTPRGTISTAPLGGSAVRSLALAPGCMVELEQVADERPAQVISAAPSVDPGMMFRAIHEAVAQQLADLGLGGAATTRDQANPTSAAALSIHDGDKRRQQRVGIEAFKDSDLELLAKCAAMVSSLPNQPLVPERGYALEYHLLPLTPDEVSEQRDGISFGLEHGLMAKVDAYMLLHPGLDEEGAIAALKRIARLDALLDPEPPEPAPPPKVGAMPEPDDPADPEDDPPGDNPSPNTPGMSGPE